MTRIDRTRFHTYIGAGSPRKLMRVVSLRQLLRIPDLYARAELSGCEGCYVEVSRWNRHTARWERFCFEKFFGSELWEGLGEVDTAVRVAAIINRVDGHYLYGHCRAGQHTRTLDLKALSVVEVRQAELKPIIHGMTSWFSK